MKEFENMPAQKLDLKIWRLHPQGVRIIPAEKTLHGSAHPDALKYCGPYTSANKYGFWVFPPMDIDLIYRGENRFEHTVVSPWENLEAPLIRSLPCADGDGKTFCQGFGGRAKVDFGRVEPNICQMWTGCIFETPPGWALLIRSPVNVGMDAPYRIQEGILETDWMPYDIWINIAVQQKDVPIRLRRDQWPPLAQLVPVPKESYGNWTVTEDVIGGDMLKRWGEYNHAKYLKKKDVMEKDSATYHKERVKHSCPFRLFGQKGKENG